MNDNERIFPIEEQGRLHKIMLWIFSLVILVASLGFVSKLYEFFHDLTNEEGLRFAGAHLLTYVLVAGGFFMLLGYAFLRGHFADIEQPKYDLLEQEERRDRHEFAQLNGRS